MAWPMKSLIVFVALPIFSICAATLYYYHIKEKEWDEYIRKVRRKEVEVKVPMSCVGSIIGRGGMNIKELQANTKTAINFKSIDGDNNYKICCIRGTKDNVEIAKTLILELINPKDMEIFEMWVPQSACGRIIGRCGDTILQISRTSNTQISIDKFRVDGNKKLIIIKGKSPDVAVAKELIERKIKEVEERRKQLFSSNQPRSPRMRSKNQKGNNTTDSKVPQYERLVSESSEGMIQVYVSSVASPSHFWLQLITPRAVDLDHLVENMTDYYNKEENKKLHKLKEVKKGQIVASQFEHDKKWYRVEVFAVEVNEMDMEESKVDVFYLDYGDSAYYRLGDLLELKPDFLNLKFQAIEVSMAGIESKNGGEDWEEEAIETFEDIVYSAQWKLMLAQVVCHKQKENTTHPGLVPCVRLYDPDGPPGVDIGKQLIEKGFAVEVKTEEPVVGSEEEWD